MVIRLKDWFRGYDEAPARIRFLRVVFAFSTLAFIISFFGPAILSGAVIGFWMYQDWALTYAGFTYIVMIIATFMIAIVSGIPTLWYEWKRMRQSKERKKGKLSTTARASRALFGFGIEFLYRISIFFKTTMGALRIEECLNEKKQCFINTISNR